MEAHHLTPADLMRRFDAARDTWIRTDLPGWLGAQAFYPGVAERLIQLLREGMEILILTTKEGRFAHRLLEAHGVPLPLPQVWGKEQASPKTDLLQRLLREQSANAGDIWFVEDRLETLRSVTKRADLEGIRLFLATWGYNTAGQREEAAADSRIVPIALKQFCGDFSAWVEPMAARSDERTNAP
jgi:phosphoglycolate phosphatase-like HAD superfamily hydrolase